MTGEAKIAQIETNILPAKSFAMLFLIVINHLHASIMNVAFCLG